MPIGLSMSRYEAEFNARLLPLRLQVIADTDIGRALCARANADSNLLRRFYKHGGTYKAATELTLCRPRADSTALAKIAADIVIDQVLGLLPRRSGMMSTSSTGPSRQTTAAVVAGPFSRLRPCRTSGPTPPGTITLGALLARAGEALRDGLPEPVWTLVAVAAVKASRGGHALELVDPAKPDSAQLRAYLPDNVMEALGRASGFAVLAMHLVGLSAVMRLTLEIHPRWGASARVTVLAPGVETSLSARAVEAGARPAPRRGSPRPAASTSGAA